MITVQELYDNSPKSFNALEESSGLAPSHTRQLTVSLNNWLFNHDKHAAGDDHEKHRSKKDSEDARV